MNEKKIKRIVKDAENLKAEALDTFASEINNVPEKHQAFFRDAMKRALNNELNLEDFKAQVGKIKWD